MPADIIHGNTYIPNAFILQIYHTHVCMCIILGLCVRVYAWVDHVCIVCIRVRTWTWVDTCIHTVDWKTFGVEKALNFKKINLINI